MAKKEKDVKTNAMRILDRMKIKYETITYECDEFVSGIECADIKGIAHELSYKTIVCRGKSGGFYVFAIPIENEINLKSAAAAVKEKSVELISVKELTPLTGYVRGGCSPIGMKKQFPCVVHSDAQKYEQIYISGGRIGSTIKLAPNDLLKAAGAVYGDIVM